MRSFDDRSSMTPDERLCEVAGIFAGAIYRHDRDVVLAARLRALGSREATVAQPMHASPEPATASTPRTRPLAQRPTSASSTPMARSC